MSYLTQQQINEQLIAYCLIGDLTQVNFCLTSSELPLKAQAQCYNHRACHIACEREDLELVDYLLNYDASFSEVISESASTKGSLRVIDYLLIDRKISIPQALYWASGSASAQVLDHLIKVHHYDPQEQNHRCFKKSCMHFNFEAALYLLSEYYDSDMIEGQHFHMKDRLLKGLVEIHAVKQRNLLDSCIDPAMKPHILQKL